MVRFALTGSALLGLAACGGEAPEPAPEETEIPEEIAAAAPAPVAADSTLGTPMEDRVATIGLVNKRNNISRNFELRPGESARADNIIIRLSACERTAPWEDPTQTGGFVQVFVNERADAQSDPEWRQIFSGWLFKESPSVNVVEHPVYDVWMKDCAMSFPGEEETAADS